MKELNFLKENVLRELRSTHTLSELNPEQRKNLHRFCKTWVDIFTNLDMLKEKSFERFINESLKGKFNDECRNWFITEISNRQQKLSVINANMMFGAIKANPTIVGKLEREIEILHRHSEVPLGRHFHVITQ